ncbi:MAG: IS110 family transposase [Candidatus Omnitrophica bacterium CG12_big_fil_rev_8_21_14_0_65_50_5]|nr:MAG: IS110 family transposase [Candidatus Omnitrophica bacterium CG12_big_fil_rev_8_21_14_0_65_50_5]
MKLYGAIDLHANNNVLTLLDEEDHVVYERRLKNDLGMIVTQLSKYQSEIEAIAVESTFNWYWLVDGLMEAGYEMRLVNTAAVKQYEGLKHTDDSSDARWLAHLLRLGILPEGYIYPKHLRAVRDLSRKRSQLVHQKTTHLLSIQNLFTRNTGKPLSANRIKTLKLEEAEKLFSDAHLVLAVMSNFRMFRYLEQEIKVLEKSILREVRLSKGFELLLSVNGIGKILALTIMLETGDIGRFAKAGDYASYCRCVNSNKMSNGKRKGRGNQKNGNKYLSWAFVETANFAIRFNPLIKRYYQRKKTRTKNVIAIKAVAHKLARACYHILRDEIPFDVSKAFA